MTDEHERLARLETKLEYIADSLERLTLHVEHLRYWKAYLVGAGAVIGLAASLLTKVLLQ